MKILFVTHRYPPHTGGVETHVREIATRLVGRGHEVTVFSADAAADVPSDHIDEGVHVRRFRSVSPEDAFYFAPQLMPAVRRVDVDVVHAHNYHAFPLFFAALGTTADRFVVTPHYHGQSPSRLRDVGLSVYRPFGRWAVRQADEVIAVSDWEQHQLRKDLGVDATVIPNGIDIERFANAEPEQRAGPYLLCVGRLEEYKGVQHVIRALPTLEEYELLIVGTGPYRGTLERIARTVGVADRVTFRGHVNTDQLPGLYAGAAVFVSLSSFEAYGMTVAEAVAAGTPCVVREQGALVDWVETDGVVGLTDTAPETVEEAVIEAAGREPSRKALQSWNAVSDELEAVYDD